jgi:hypothetical protein
MIKIFKCAIFVVIILVAVGCEMGDIMAPLDPSVPGRPTVPLKRRPIVPSTKLPRPRVAGEEFAAIEAEAYEAAEWDYYEEW